MNFIQQLQDMAENNLDDLVKLLSDNLNDKTLKSLQDKLVNIAKDENGEPLSIEDFMMKARYPDGLVYCVHCGCYEVVGNGRTKLKRQLNGQLKGVSSKYISNYIALVNFALYALRTAKTDMEYKANHLLKIACSKFMTVTRKAMPSREPLYTV